MIQKIFILGLCMIAIANAGRKLREIENNRVKTLPQLSIESELFESEDRQCTEADPTPQIANYFGAVYFGSISIGTPEQNFTALWHTAKPYTWIPTTQCESIFCNLHYLYNSTSSNTYQKNGANFTMNYRRGTVWGYLSADTFQIGDMIINNQIFAEISSEEGYGFVSEPYDGVIGLQRSSPDSGAPSILDNMMQQGVLKKKVFSLHYNDDSGEAGISFGSPDPQYYKGNITYVPVRDDTKWVIKMDSVTFGPLKLCKCGCLAHIDTESSVITGPTKDIEALHKVIGGMSIRGGEYLIKCNEIASFPTAEFVIGKKSILLKPRDYAVQLGESEGHYCLSCFKGVDNPEGPKWVIGDALLKKVFMVFDMEKNQVGIADPA